MAKSTLQILLIMIASLGWTLFFITIFNICKNKKQELKLIQDIRRDLAIIKQDVISLKQNNS